MSNKSVSIIIPVLNGGEYFKRCIKSIKASIAKYDGYSEIIVVDNGSTDDTRKFLKEQKISFFIKPQLTISGLRNFGAKHATGEVIAFIDADVIVDINWLNNAMKYFNSSEVVCVGSSPFPPENATWVSKTFNLLIEYRGVYSTSRTWLVSSNMFVKKDVFFETGGFNERLLTAEDVDFGIRLSRKYRIIYDRNIRTFHLGEAATLNELFFKELWRGRHNVKGFFYHKLNFRELPSILLPIYHLVLILFFFVSVFINLKLSLLILSLLFFPSLLISIIVVSNLKKYNYLFKLFLIYLVYSIARALAIIPWRI